MPTQPAMKAEPKTWIRPDRKGMHRQAFRPPFSLATRPMVALSKNTGTKPQMIRTGLLKMISAMIATSCPARPARKPKVTALASPKP